MSEFARAPTRAVSLVVLLLIGSVISLPGSALAEDWDAVFTGLDSPADNVPNYVRWDNPIDDDWEPSSAGPRGCAPPDRISFCLNTDEAGNLVPQPPATQPTLMRVDRATDPIDDGKTGNIWIRDPILSNAAGLTLEVRVKILSNSTIDAFRMSYVDEMGSLGVSLSPTMIKAGPLFPCEAPPNDQCGDRTHTPYPGSDFHTYRIVKEPGPHTTPNNFKVYIDNTLRLTSEGSASPSSGGAGGSLSHPRVLIGDPTGNAKYQANYVLDYVRYHRGATDPGETPPSLTPRPLVNPPAAVNETWADNYYGNTRPGEGTYGDGTDGAEWKRLGTITAWTPSQGRMLLDTADGKANSSAYRCTPKSGDPNHCEDQGQGSLTTWDNLQPVTIEAEIQVEPETDEGGFQLLAYDHYGGTGLVLWPGKAALVTATKPTGAAVVPVSNPYIEHKYRLVRSHTIPGGPVYWHLYIDNQLKLNHWHASGPLDDISKISFGDVAFPCPNYPSNATGARVYIDNLRWHEGGNAPPAAAAAAASAQATSTSAELLASPIAPALAGGSAWSCWKARG